MRQSVFDVKRQIYFGYCPPGKTLLNITKITSEQRSNDPRSIRTDLWPGKIVRKKLCEWDHSAKFILDKNLFVPAETTF